MGAQRKVLENKEHLRRRTGGETSHRPWKIQKGGERNTQSLLRMQYKGRIPVLVAIRSDPVGRAASAERLLPPSFLLWQTRLVQTWFTSPGYGGLILAGIRIQFLHPLNYQAAMRRMLFLGWGAK